MIWLRWRRKQPTDPLEVVPLRRGTCPHCGSARHSRVIEEQPDGEVVIIKGCRLCGTVWVAEETAVTDSAETDRRCSSAGNHPIEVIRKHEADTTSTVISRDIAGGGGDMADILIRDLPEAVVAALDIRAAHLGLSRSEYLRRRLAQEAVNSPEPVTVEHLIAFGETFGDLGDPEIMKGAWG